MIGNCPPLCQIWSVILTLLLLFYDCAHHPELYSNYMEPDFTPHIPALTFWREGTLYGGRPFSAHNDDDDSYQFSDDNQEEDYGTAELPFLLGVIALEAKCYSYTHLKQ